MSLVLIRCDSSYQIGSGHVMRCLALAELLRQSGKQVEFLCQKLPGNFIKVIIEKKFPVHEVPESCSLDFEIQKTHEILSGKHKSILIVDHYQRDASYEGSFRKSSKVLVVDDLDDRIHSCDLLIDTNFRASYENCYVKNAPGAIKLLGPRYALLRDEFRHIENQPAPWTSRREQLLVFFGGTDPDGFSLKYLKSIPKKLDYQVVLIITKNSRFLDEIQQLPPNSACQVVVNPSSMARLLLSSRLYFGSAGSITWERMFLGLPGVIVDVADNQKYLANQLHLAHLQYYWGSASQLDFKSIHTKLGLLMKNDALLQELSIKNRSLVHPIDIDDIHKGLQL